MSANDAAQTSVPLPARTAESFCLNQTKSIYLALYRLFVYWQYV